MLLYHYDLKKYDHFLNTVHFKKRGIVMTENNLRNLLSEMSLMEKIGELHQMPGEYYYQGGVATGENATLQFPQDIVDTIGSTLNVRTPEKIIEVQKKHMERHPHHIPMLFMLDIIHGLYTTFPVPLAQACSFDPELVEKMASATAKEACVSGYHVTFSPMVDLARDARWGRVTESSGEDPYLNSVMAAAAVKGYQGDDLSKEGTLCACVKHFAAYGGVEGGREYGSVDVSERTLRQYYLPPYKAACDAGSGMLMCAFNAIGGVPATADKHLMKDILRDEWGYDGAVITDYGSMNNMQSHRISDRDEDLARLALEATVNIEMCVGRYAKGLPEALKNGTITMEQIDACVWQVLKLKNRLGLFENPFHFADPEKAKEIARNEQMMNLALDAVNKTSVLLKNDDKILPLSDKKRIAFIGPYLNDARILGAWTAYPNYETETVESVLKKRFKQADFLYDKGCAMVGEEQPDNDFCNITDFEADAISRRENIERAVKIAQQADVVVMLVGEHPRFGGELASRVHIDIPIIQQELFRAVAAVNENIVTVLFNHRPLDLCELSNKSKALLDVWFPGTKGAQGIVNMLFGDTAPEGRLTMCFPRSVGQCPIFYNRLPTDHSPEFVTHFVTGYIDSPIEPLYSFGEGMTYTDFAYGEIMLDKSKLHDGETLTASITVKNTGNRDGCETVQLYIRDVYASVSRPVKELKRFKKVAIKAGETVTVEFTLTPDDFRFYNVEMEYVWEPGEIQVFIGKNSLCTEYKTFELVKE